jgi:chorismate-pyruvate lyase
VNVPLVREFFPHDNVRALSLLRLLLGQDGSTTRLCEVIAGGPVELHLHSQSRVETVPDGVLEFLGGASWIERITSLHVAGHVMMDNLTWTRVDRIPTEFADDLERGELPVGRLLDRLFVKRQIVSASSLGEVLWNQTGLPDPRASRAYTISTQVGSSDQGAFMLVFETYRAEIARRFQRQNASGRFSSASRKRGR